MEMHENHDWMIREWTELLEAFKQILDHIERIHQEPLAHPVRIHFEKSGKAFLKTLNKIDYPFDISRDYRKKPHGKGEDTKKYGCYNEYWICIVSLFCRKDPKFMEFWNAKDYYLPAAWDYINDDPFEAEAYFMVTDEGSDIVNFDILKDICNASAVLCEYIIKLRSEQRLRTHPDPQKQTISYKNKTIRFGGENNWIVFKLLYDNKDKDDAVFDSVIKEATGSDQNVVNIINDLKKYLTNKHNAKVIADAIDNQRSVGYYLDSDKI